MAPDNNTPTGDDVSIDGGSDLAPGKINVNRIELGKRPNEPVEVVVI